MNKIHYIFFRFNVSIDAIKRVAMRIRQSQFMVEYKATISR